MHEQNPTYTSYDPVNSPIMEPQHQLDAPEFGAAAITPLAMLGLGLAGAAAFALTRRKKPTLQERVMTLLEDTRDDAVDLAEDARKEIKPLAEDAKKKGMKLFKRGSKAATAAGAELLKHGSEAADQAYEQVQHFKKHEGQDLAKKASKASKEAAKTAEKGRKSALSTYRSLEEKYPILTGLLVAALMSEGRKLFESYRTRNA